MKTLLKLAAFLAVCSPCFAQYLPWDLVTYQIDGTATGAASYTTVVAPDNAAPGDVEGICCFDPVTKIWFGMKNDATIKINWIAGTIGVDQTKFPAVQRKRAQTDASGNYTWTYTTAYGGGVIPVISVVAEGGTTVPLNVQLVSAPTNTSVTFKVLSLPSTSVLGITVLGVPTGTQAYLDMTAVAP